jgi:HYR domain
MSTHAELRPPPADEASDQRSLLSDIWAAVSTEEVAVRVFVAIVVTAAVGWLGLKVAAAAVIGTQLMTEAVKAFIRRRKVSRKTLWLLSLLLLLFQSAQRAWAAVSDKFGLKHRPSRRAPPTGLRGSLIMGVAATAVTVAAFTIPEVALGHQLVGHRRTTFFSTGNMSGFRLLLPHPVTVEATGADGARVTYDVSATRGVVRCSRASGSIFPIGTTTVTCVARARAARLSGTFDVRVVDNQGPVLQLPTGIDRRILSDTIALRFAASARDRVDGSVPVRCMPASGATYKLGKTTVTCSAADKHGNRTTRSFVVDLTRAPPGSVVFTFPTNRVVEATGLDGAVFTYSVSATDASGHSVSVRCSPRSGTTLAIGTDSVACSAGTQQQSFDVTVRDTTAPTIDIRANPSVEADSKDGAVVTYTGSATDKVSGTVTPSCDPASGTKLAIGSHGITCTAKDAAGNEATRSVTVKVFDGPPALTVPADITQDYQNPKGAYVKYLPATATDKVDGTLRPTCTRASGSFFPLGKTTVTCDVTDSAGNHVSKTFTVSIVDRVLPVVTVPKDMSVVASPNETTHVVAFDVSARDAIDGAVSVTCSPPSGYAFPVGKTTTVTCKATDRSGNTGSNSFTVYPYVIG